jgi:periplasmic protein TonB
VPPPPPPPPPKPQPQIATRSFTPPVVTEDDKVTKPEDIPRMEDIKDAVSNVKKDGVKGDLPPIIEAPAPPIEVPDVKEQPVDNTVRETYNVEQVPEFMNGMAAMYKFLGENIKYPNVARENGIQGTVYVGFVVWKDGSLRNVEVKRGIAGGCSEEALRVVKLMPNWRPGKQNGKAVPVSFTIPIKFKLD